MLTVVTTSPAAQAGIRPEDLIIDIDGVGVADVGDLQRLMTAGRIGARISVGVFRAGTIERVTVIPTELL